MLQGLADLVGLSYLLARRLGFDFSRLDSMLIQRLEGLKILMKLILKSSGEI
jgi:hypothetical protein